MGCVGVVFLFVCFSLAVLLFGFVLDVFFCCHVLLLVIWLGLDVIGLVFVVGLEFGVVGNVVLEGCCFGMIRMFLFCL